jgi:ribosomal-protein-alanine N-acetyltransferase
MPATVRVKLVAIDASGEPPAGLPADELSSTVCAAYAELYAREGRRPPWIGYLALDGTEAVGTCGFKAPPCGGRVEIAYYTYPAHERRGYGSAMARALLEKARGEDPAVVVTARTLPQECASTRILTNAGFNFEGELVDPEDGTVWSWRRSPPA